MSERRTGESVTVESVKAKKNGVHVVLSNGEKLTLSVDSFTEFHLYMGKELQDEELASIMEFANQDKAYDTALRYLGRDAYSSMELQRKLLAKDFEYRQVRSVIDRLEDSGLLNDEQFAHTFAEDVAGLRLIGRNRILYELREKGIGEDVLKTLSFPSEVELEKACAYATSLDKRYYRTPRARKSFKIHSALLTRGFDEEIAHEAVNRCITATDPGVEKSELDKALVLAKAKYSRKYEGYELRTHMYAYLIRKGFPHDEVQAILEENK